MSLHLGGVFQTGAEALDIGLSDSVVVTNPGGTFVIMTSGAAGGLTVYQLSATGTLSLHDAQIFPQLLQPGLSGLLTVSQVNGETVLFFGGDSSAAWGHVLQPDGTIGPLFSVDWLSMEQAAFGNVPGALQTWGQLSAEIGLAVPTPIATDNLVALQNMSGTPDTYILSLDGSTGQLFSHAASGSGGYAQIATLGAAQGLALGAPTAMATASFSTGAFALVASSTGSSISVISVGADGSLSPVQQVIDTASTRFANIQDLTVVQDGDHVFVLAVGGDHGVSLFRLLPDGHLVFQESFSDDLGGLLDTPTTVNAHIQNGVLHAFVGTQSTASMVHLQADLTTLGSVAASSASGADLLAGGSGDDVLLAGSQGDTLQGGGGDDILSSGPGQSTLSGGTGRDHFVIRAESTRVSISDFQPGQDRLDLSDLPMLRNMGQILVTTTATGAIIRFREVEIVVTSASATPLTIADLFPNGLIGPDSMLVIAGELEPVPPPGRAFWGTNTHDSILGGEGNDTIRAARGNDTLRGYDGDDLLFGEMGHDRIWGGNGNDTLHGNEGNDMIGGGAGNDLIFGGAGNDSIYGGSGDDTLHGEGGDTRLWGMSGNDLRYGSDAGGRIGGGAGDDTIYGGAGSDTIYGGAIAGNDYIHAGGGDDEIWGMDGNDTLLGGAGDDFIGGGLGSDRIHAGPGDDTVRGAADADSFVFMDGDDRLLIEDFSFAEGDTLELDSALWGGGLSPAEVVAAHGSVIAGAIVLDFGTGDIVTLAGVSDPGLLSDHIVII